MFLSLARSVMLRIGRLFDWMSLLGPARATDPTSLPPPLYVSPISFENIFLLTHPSHASQCHAAVSPPHSAFTAADISPVLPHPTLLTPRSCPLRAPPAPPGASPASANAGVPSRTSGRSLQSQGHPRAGGARTLPLDAGSYFEVRINWPWPFPTPML